MTKVIVSHDFCHFFVREFIPKVILYKKYSYDINYKNNNIFLIWGEMFF